MFGDDGLIQSSSTTGFSASDANCILALEFENNVNDSSSVANNGSTTGSPTYEAGSVSSNWIVLNGTSQYVDFTNVSSYNLTSAVSISAWIKPSSTGGPREFISKRSAWSSTGIPFEMTMDGTQLSGRVMGNTVVNTASGVINANTLYHVGMTWDGSTLRLYVNGSEVTNGARSGTITDNSTAIRVGALTDGTEKYAGRIDRVFIFNTTKSAADMLDEYNRYH